MLIDIINHSHISLFNTRKKRRHIVIAIFIGRYKLVSANVHIIEPEKAHTTDHQMRTETTCFSPLSRRFCINLIRMVQNRVVNLRGVLVTLRHLSTKQNSIIRIHKLCALYRLSCIRVRFVFHIRRRKEIQCLAQYCINIIIRISCSSRRRLVNQFRTISVQRIKSLTCIPTAELIRILFVGTAHTHSIYETIKLLIRNITVQVRTVKNGTNRFHEKRRPGRIAFA